MTKKHVRFICEKYLSTLELLLNDLIANEEELNFKLEDIEFTLGEKTLATCVFKFNNLKLKSDSFPKHVKIVTESKLPNLEKSANKIISIEEQNRYKLKFFKLIPGTTTNYAFLVFGSNPNKIKNLRKNISSQIKIMKDKNVVNLEKRINDHIKKMSEKSLSLENLNINYDSSQESYIAALTLQTSLQKEII